MAKRHVINLINVKNNAKNTIKYIQNEVQKLGFKGRNVVFFLGEEHNNEADRTVTRGILNEPPIITHDATRLILERGLDNVYINRAVSINSVRSETMNATQGLGRQKRSEYIANMVTRAINEEDIRTIYIACGSAHSEEIFKDLNKRHGDDLYYISKPSCTD